MNRIATILIVVCMSTGAALAQGEAKDRGAWFELSYSHRPLLVDNDFALPTAQGGFFAGYKFGLASVGVGIELMRLSLSQEFADFQDEEAITHLLFMPGVRYTFLRSADSRVELFGQFDIGLGKIYIYDDNNDDVIEPSRFAYQIGPGVRYWVHPQFGFGAMAGLRGEYVTTSDDENTFSSTTGTTSVTTSFQITGVF